MSDTIAILSDTHGLLRPEVLERIRGCSAILHCGDFDTPEVLAQLEAVAPVYGVRGNNDFGRWAAVLPEARRLELFGVRFFMVHDSYDVPARLTDTDIVLFGHSHKWHREMRSGTLWLNPGSCGHRRFRLPLTFALMETEGGQYHIERVNLDEL